MKNKYNDINFVPTNMKGQVILQAGLNRYIDFDLYEVSVQVPLEFVEQILKWKKDSDELKKIKYNGG